MMFFDPTKLRDPLLRSQIQEKEATIKRLLERNDFITLSTHKHLVEELRRLYTLAQEGYDRHFMQNWSDYSGLQARVSAAQDRIHPLRYADIQEKLEAIKRFLSAEHYSVNAEAAPYIKEASNMLEAAKAEMEKWKTELRIYLSRLSDLMNRIWAEDYASLKAEYQKEKNCLSSLTYPSATIQLNESNIKELIQNREEAINKAILKSTYAPRLKKQIESLTGTYCFRADFEKIISKVNNYQRNLFTGLVGGGLLIAALVIGLLVQGPAMLRRVQEKNSWEMVSAENTYKAYKQFLDVFPSGEYSEKARQAILLLKTGEIEGFRLQGIVGRYIGELAEGLPDGEGRADFISKAWYEGTWVRGLPHGKGIFWYADSVRYEGDWLEGTKHGKGTQSWPTGDRYTGDWVNGTLTGYGTYTFKDGSKYEGYWKGDQYEGRGIFHFPDSGRYEGNWKSGKREGRGTYIWADGRKFTGDWKNDLREGEGSLEWPAGGILVGIWKKGLLNGKASFTSRFRDELSGIFVEDSTGISIYDSQGVLVVKGLISNGLFKKIE